MNTNHLWNCCSFNYQENGRQDSSCILFKKIAASALFPLFNPKNPGKISYDEYVKIDTRNNYQNLSQLYYNKT